jgi:uncharacterized UPF0146 family protein
MHSSLSKLHILLGKLARLAEIGTGMFQGINRELIREFYFRITDFIAERIWQNADSAETQTDDVAQPNLEGCSCTDVQTSA